MAKLTPEACRAARALLNWSQNDLARAAAMSATTINKFERGEEVTEASALKLSAALETHGVEILNGNNPGARISAR